MATKSIEIGREQYGYDSLIGASMPTGGFLFSCWVKCFDPGDPPWNRSNVEIFNCYADESWLLRCIVGNGGVDEYGEAVYTAALMWFGWDGADWGIGGDYNHAVWELTEAQVNGWVWVAWQVIWDAAGTTTFRQWTKFGMDGDINGPQETTLTLTQLRTALVNNGWTQQQADAWTPASNADSFVIGTQWASGNCYVTHARMASLATLPSNATLDDIATTGDADTSAWGDWELKWSSGAADLTDRSGGAGPDLTVDEGYWQGAVYEGVDGPEFPASGVTGSGSASCVATTVSAAGQEVLQGSSAAACAASTIGATGQEILQGSGAGDATASIAEAAGQVVVQSTCTATNAATTATGAGTSILQGSCTTTCMPTEAIATGSEVLQGSVAASATASMAVGSGSVGSDTITGTGSVLAAAPTAAGEGTEVLQASGAPVATAATAVGSATETATGEGAASGTATTAVGSGDVGGAAITGSGSVSTSATMASGNSQLVLHGDAVLLATATTLTGNGGVVATSTGAALAAASTASGSGWTGTEISSSGSAFLSATLANGVGWILSNPERRNKKVGRNVMNQKTTWLKASDGTQAVDMQVELVTPWLPGGVDKIVAGQILTPAGPVGAYSLEQSNEGNASQSSVTSAMVSVMAPTLIGSQPGGTEGTLGIYGLSVMNAWRLKWTPSSGGTGILPTKTWIGW